MYVYYIYIYIYIHVISYVLSAKRGDPSHLRRLQRGGLGGHRGVLSLLLLLLHYYVYYYYVYVLFILLSSYYYCFNVLLFITITL